MTEETATARVMESEESHQLPLAWLSLLALGLGVVTGFGAVLFRALIGFIHNLLFTGSRGQSTTTRTSLPRPSPWGALVILVPVLGAIGVTFLVTNLRLRPRAMGSRR